MLSSVLPTTVSAIFPGSTPLASSAPVTASRTATVATGSSGVTAAPYPPMTTHWSKPLSCTWTYVVDNQLPPSNIGADAWLDLEPIPGASSLSCYPDGMFYGGRTGVFSPATCPNGWTTVSISVNTDQVSDDATTTALCCSSEYTLDGRYCKRRVPTVLAVPITYNRTGSTYEVMTSSTATLYSATMAVHTIRALFRSKDQAILGITDGDDIDDDPEPWHLSMAAKIGIGVGVTMFGLLSLTGLIMLFLRRRQKKRDRAKGRSLHEMESIHESGGYFHEISSSSPSRAPDTSQYGQGRAAPREGDAGGSAENEAEIRALMAQKAAIQRRIEELERGADEDAR